MSEEKHYKTGKTRDRETAYRAVVNTWLKANPENTQYCGQVIQQNRERKLLNSDEFGSMNEFPDDVRIGLSIPVGLYYVLLKFERMHGREFMKDKKDLRWFAKKFPQFCIVERI